MTVKATRAIKISENAHYQLKIMAAKYREHVWELIDQAVVLLGRQKAAEKREQVERRA